MTALRRPINRRTALATLVSGGLLLTGCTGGVDLPGRPSPSPSPTPTPLPGTTEATLLENDLAARCEEILGTFSDRLDRTERALLTKITDAHRAHAAVLERTDPVQLPDPTPSPAPTSTAPATETPAGTASAEPSASGSAAPPPIGDNPKQAFDGLREMEHRAARSYRVLAREPEGPQDQLRRLAQLWGSLATAAASYREACRRRENSGSELLGTRRLTAQLPDETTAVQDVVAQTHAIIYGYQTAIAALSERTEERARGQLTDARVLRDRLSAWLVEHDSDVPVADPGYDLPVKPTGPGKASRLISTMERRLLPYLGQWLATAEDEQDRKDAVSTMINTARTDVIWSGRITVWPGWPTEET